MSTDPNDLTALTPGHFLIGEPLTSQVDRSAPQPIISTATRWKLVSQVKHEFWRRWRLEYLNQLQEKRKWKNQSGNVREDEMVIIKEDNVPPLKWPLGRIVRTYQGDDGVVRVVDVKTEKGILKRAIHHLAPLPVNIENNADQDQEQEPEEVPKKKKRLPSFSNILALVLTLMILPMIMGSPIQVKKFEPTVGLHFEHIGSNQIIASEWNLVIYYDLTPLRTEIQLMINGTDAMQHICQQLQQKSWCEELVTQFRHTNTELALDNSLLIPHRQKRGAINLLGNLANSLFGVLDSEYASRMSETISAVENNEHHLAQLAKEQTSIIDSTINIIKRDRMAAQNTFTKVEKRITEIVNRMHNDERDAHNERMFQVLLSLALQLITTTADIQRTQSSIINVLTNVHHGQISPQLLSPQQLNEELIKITAHLPSTRQIPGYHGNLLSIYKLMTVKGGITKKHAIFKITVPLIGSDKFELYRLIPIPTLANNTMMAIKSTTPILAITLHRDKYFPTSMELLQSCTKLDEEAYLCPNSQPIYNKGAATCACEVNLFNNETSARCEFVKVDDHVWTQTNQRNKWIFALSSPIQMTAVCNDQVSQIPLEGSGFLQIAPECVIKYKHLTLMGNQLFSSTLSASYTSFGQLPELKRPNPPLPVSPTNIEDQYDTRLQELTALQKLLQSQEFNDLPNEIRPHDIHHYAAIYICFLLLACMVAWMIWRHIQRRHKVVPQLPQPKPRSHLAQAPQLQQDLTQYV